MITTFADKVTEKIFTGQKTRFLPPEILKRALMRLDRIDSAVCIDDLRFPPSHHLEKLTGNRAGQWSIRINDQWRVCFEFDNGNASNVEIVDYH
jgi:proteic killer suppression protein